MNRNPEPAAGRRAADGGPRRRLPVILALLAVAAIAAAGCGGDDTAAAPSISDITSDADAYAGETVTLRGEVGDIFFPRGGFMLDEADGGDDVIVYDMILPLGVAEGDDVEVKGTVRLVDDDFRKEAGDQFFDDLAFDDVKGQPAIDASSVRDPTAEPVATGGDFDTLDADGDSYLDADEIAERADVRGIFDAWDIDADSELDRDDIARNAFGLWDRDTNRKISEQEWRTGSELWYPDGAKLVVFDDVDGDGDSELDRDEFSERFDVSALGEAWEPKTLDEKTFERAFFGLYDTDDDGRISRDEWAYGAHAFGTPAE